MQIAFNLDRSQIDLTTDMNNRTGSIVCDEPVLKPIDGHLGKTTRSSVFVSKWYCEFSEIGSECSQYVPLDFPPEWRLLKKQVYRFSVGGKNGAFQKRLCHNSLCQPRQYRWRYWYMRIEQKNVRAEPGQWKQKRIFGSSRGRSKP